MTVTPVGPALLHVSATLPESDATLPESSSEQLVSVGVSVGSASHHGGRCKQRAFVHQGRGAQKRSCVSIPPKPDDYVAALSLSCATLWRTSRFEMLVSTPGLSTAEAVDGQRHYEQRPMKPLSKECDCGVQKKDHTVK